MAAIDQTDKRTARAEAKAARKAERAAKREALLATVKYPRMVFGTMKTGYLELKGDGRMEYTGPKTFKPLKFHVDNVTEIAIEDGAALERRSTVMRAGGGAVAGAVLLGPVGLLAGLGLGAIAKKQAGGGKFLVIELDDETTIIAEVAPKHAANAIKLRHAVQGA